MKASGKVVGATANFAVEVDPADMSPCLSPFASYSALDALAAFDAGTAQRMFYTFLPLHTANIPNIG